MLADDKVRCTGEPLAIVVADSRAVAEDAVELVDVDIDPLPAVCPSPTPSILRVHLCSTSRARTSSSTAEDRYGDVDAAFVQAHTIVSETFTQERMANVPLEGA